MLQQPSNRIRDIVGGTTRPAVVRPKPAATRASLRRRMPAVGPKVMIISGLCVLALAIALASLVRLGPWFRAPDLKTLSGVEAAIGKHYLLPTGEDPALATVEDETKVTAPFLRQTKNGDKLLIYAKAKEVIIYRPSIDRIVAVGPVFIDDQGAAAE